MLFVRGSFYSWKSIESRQLTGTSWRNMVIRSGRQTEDLSITRESVAFLAGVSDNGTYYDTTRVVLFVGV